MEYAVRNVNGAQSSAVMVLSNHDLVQEIPNTQIRAAFDVHQAAMQRLADRISTLSQKVVPILRPITPSPENGAKGELKPLAPLATALYDSASQLDKLSKALDDILDRIEL